MSYINKLDLLFEANEGPSRRDFNKTVLGTALSTAIPININASPVSAGIKAVRSGGRYTFPLMGDLINKCVKEIPLMKQIAMIPLQTRKEVLKRFWGSGEEGSWNAANSLLPADKRPKQIITDNPIVKAVKAGLLAHDGKDIKDFSDSDSDFTRHIFGYYMHDGSDGFSNKQISAIIDLLIKKAGGTDAFAKLYLSDWINYSTDEPVTIGIEIFQEFCRSQPSLRNLVKNFAGKSIEEKIKMCHEKGFISDEDVTTAEEEIQEKKEIEEEGRTTAEEEIQEKKEVEEEERADLEDQKIADFNNRSDDEALNSWENEGGALGPLDEAIRRLLNVIY